MLLWEIGARCPAVCARPLHAAAVPRGWYYTAIGLFLCMILSVRYCRYSGRCITVVRASRTSSTVATQLPVVTLTQHPPKVFSPLYVM